MEDLLADLGELEGDIDDDEEEDDNSNNNVDATNNATTNNNRSSGSSSSSGRNGNGVKKRKREEEEEEEEEEADEDEDVEGEGAMEEEEEGNDDDGGGEEERDGVGLNQRDLLSGDMFKQKNIYAIAKLLQSRSLQEMMKKIDEFNSKGQQTFYGPLEEHPEYKLIVASNRMTAEIENEVVTIHKFIRDHYAGKFPELESLVLHPMDYARTVKAIGNETDLTKIDLSNILPSATVMVVTINASTTIGQPLNEEQLRVVIEACDMALELEAARKKILGYVESRMSLLAPNVTAIVGSTIAAQLLGLAGGLTSLSKMPACNVQVLGQKKKTLTGFSSATANFHQGFIFGSSMVMETPPEWRVKAARQVAAKVTLVARVDSCHEAPDGSIGRKYREEILKKIEQWQEVPIGKQEKALPVPDEVHKKRRGGKKAKRMKDRLQLTELGKQANRMSFTAPEEETFIGDEFHGLGMLGKDTGRVRATVMETKNKLTLSRKQQLQQQKTVKSHGGSSVSGLASSLVFTPVAGIELQNPNVLEQERKLKEMSNRWFSNMAGFRKADSSSSSSSAASSSTGPPPPRPPSSTTSTSTTTSSSS